MVNPSERFVLEQWLEWVRSLVELGFTHHQAHELAHVKYEYQAGALSEYAVTSPERRPTLGRP